MKRWSYFAASLALSACAGITLPSIAQTALAADEKPADTKTETVLDNLTNPCGVAVQPETGDLFIADSGAGRVIRVRAGKAEDVITGFQKDVYGKGPMFDIGPLGLAFIDKDTLVVGGGDLVDEKELVRVFTVPAAGSPAIKVDAAKAALGPLNAKGEIKAEGNYYGVSITRDAKGAADGIYVTCNGDDTKGWIGKITIKDGKFGELERSIATKEAVSVDAPVAITVSPRGELVVGQMGEINVPKDGLLTFYNAKTGKLLMNLETGLYDITGLAYSPKAPGSLYATDYAWMKNDEGGLFRLDKSTTDGKQAIKAVKLASIERPTALVFTADGTLYITTIGEPNKANGKLLKVAPGL